jgi:glycosyltransferase involved in cell wall biosynthesis
MLHRILIIITRPFDPNAGGVQRSTYKISSYLKQKGHNTNVFSFYKEGNLPQDVANLYTALHSGAHRNKKNYKRLEQVIEEIKPDIVINQFPYENLLGQILKKAKKKNDFLLLGCLRNTLFPVKNNIDSYLNQVVPRYLHYILDNKAGKSLFQKIHKSKHTKSLKFILDTYDYFIMFGPPNIDELKYFVGDYKLHKTHLIPNSILSVFPEVPSKEKRILWLSRLNYKQKRADLLLPFWKKIMHELPDWQFDIIGDGDAFEDIKRQIEQENIPRVNMYGKQVPYEYYKRSPIYVMTSAYEGFPNTLVEAQSFGCAPVVYNSYPVCSWLLKGGKSGVLIPPFEVNTMGKEVIKLAKNQNLREQLMKAALKNADEFHLKNVGKLWTDFFDKQLNYKN